MFINFICAIYLITATANAYTIEVPPQASRCFFEDLVLGQSIHILYQVAGGGDFDIDFWVTDPTQKIIHVDNKNSHATFTFKTELIGRYTYCFSNQLSSQFMKIVQFTITGADTKPVDVSVIVDPFLNLVQELSNELHAIKDEQEFVVTREIIHSDTVEQMNGRVLFWGLFQTALLVVVCMFQVYYLKHFFEVKRVL